MAKVFLATNSIETSVEFGEAIRNLIADEDHHSFFPDGKSWVDPASSAKRFKTPARLAVTDSQPSFQALGLRARFIGKGPTHLIIDDPYSSPEDAASPTINEKTWRFWQRAALPRIGPDCNVLVFFHSYHVDDLAARMAQDKRFKRVRFPILADDNADGADPTGRKPGQPLSPLRPRSWCLKWQADDPEGFASMGQGSPVVEGDALINPNWFKEIDWEDVPELRFYHRGYDLALKKRGKKGKATDETATAICGFDSKWNFYIFEIEHWREDTPITLEKIEQNHKIDPAGTFIVLYDEVSHISSTQQLTYHSDIPIHEVPSYNQNKWARAQAMATHARKGGVFLVRPPRKETDCLKQHKPVPKDRLGHWIPWFKNQSLYFRNLDTDKDDGIDAVACSYNHAYTTKGKEVVDRSGPTPGTRAYYREQAKRQAP